jgi:hypothetical protein
MKEDSSALLPNAVVGPGSASSRRSCSAIIDITSHLSGLIAQYMLLGNFDLVVSKRVASPTPKIIDNYELRPKLSYIYHYSSAVPSINAVSNNSSAAYLINNHPVTNTPTHQRSRPQLPTSTRPIYVCSSYTILQSCLHPKLPTTTPMPQSLLPSTLQHSQLSASTASKSPSPIPYCSIYHSHTILSTVLYNFLSCFLHILPPFLALSMSNLAEWVQFKAAQAISFNRLRHEKGILYCLATVKIRFGGKIQC